jgi:uncharacterized protein (DUF1499 family)
LEETAGAESAGAAPVPGPRKVGRRRWLMGTAAAAVLLFGLLNRRWWTLNDITTGQTPEYPDLPSHIYAVDPVATRVVAETVCAAIPRWHVVSAPAPDRRSTPPVQVEVRTALFDFTDDMTVRFEAMKAPAGSVVATYTRVVIRSHSRAGKGDLGENERHIRALQREMDLRLPRIFPRH